MRDVLSLVVFVIKLLCLVVFLIMLKPDVIKAVHGTNEPMHCNTRHTSAQECGSNALAASRNE